MKDALLVDAKKRMHQSLERTQHEFNTIRTGRASVSLLDNIYIDYYGSKTLLKHMSNVSIPEPRVILISPYEPKFLKEIETQISKSDLGINPSNNGKVIRLNVPPLNEERRKELVKLVRKIAEDGRIAIRNIRREINDEFKNNFLKAINDDLNMPKALAVVQELLKLDLSEEDKLATVLDFDKVLGLNLDKIGEEEVPRVIRELVIERRTARKEKNWKESDKLREKIEKLGYIIEDTKDGSRVFKK